MSTAGEIITALTQPAAKLIDTVSGAIGKIYEPRYKRKMADAAAYEIDKVGEALRNNSDVIIQYSNEGVVASTPEFDDLVKRTQYRIAFQELQKQQNIEKVIDNAYNDLEKEETVSEEPVSQDWMSRFFNCMEDVCDEDMQILWGRILAGEVKKPGSFSKRALETVRNLSQQEARTFEKISPFLLNSGGTVFLSANEDILKKNNISFVDVLTLDECGLIVADSLLTLKIKINNSHDHIIGSGDYLIDIGCSNSIMTEISFKLYPLTQIGKELFNIIDAKTNEQYMIDFAEKLFDSAKHKNVVVSMHKVDSFDGEGYNCQIQPIKQWSNKKI